MNGPTDSPRDAQFDAQARRLHQAALTQLTPRTLARLRAGRVATQLPATRRIWPWLAATAFSGMLAAVIGVQWLSDSSRGAPDSMPIASQSARPDMSDNGAALLDENPELYLWLASAEAQPLAME